MYHNRFSTCDGCGQLIKKEYRVAGLSMKSMEEIRNGEENNTVSADITIMNFGVSVEIQLFEDVYC